ncbi:MAG: hypothetical protein LBT40_12185 [Deltaproteobacteria bacterium]|jgi:Flp pilus assembly protein TadB|nr:hypothetical protein [Deltaproteobacteria bacterium]
MSKNDNRLKSLPSPVEIPPTDDLLLEDDAGKSLADNLKDEKPLTLTAFLSQEYEEKKSQIRSNTATIKKLNEKLLSTVQEKDAIIFDITENKNAEIRGIEKKMEMTLRDKDRVDGENGKMKKLFRVIAIFAFAAAIAYLIDSALMENGITPLKIIFSLFTAVPVLVGAYIVNSKDKNTKN